jgi:hypothetical protein
MPSLHEQLPGFVIVAAIMVTTLATLWLFGI